MRAAFAFLALVAVLPATAWAADVKEPMEGWHFRFREFPIGAWWGPGAVDAEMKAYKAAGFNVVMTGRYMQMDDYGNPTHAAMELDLARKHGLWVMFDTYTRNGKPWGGVGSFTDNHPTHHPASPGELQWLCERFGSHPALAGFLLGDDKSGLDARMVECTRYLHEKAPDLMPWICQNASNARSLAENGNPIHNVQIYPTLYQPRLPAEDQARLYCEAYARMRRDARQYGLLMWPMFNVAGGEPPAKYLESDSLARFPAYAALAYGAQGLWYFTYNGGAIQQTGRYESEEAVREALTPLYPVVQEANLRIREWGPLLLGRECAGLFGTSWSPGVEWPFPEAETAATSPAALAPPAPGKLVMEMSGDLLVGILTRTGEAPLAMVVDCRVAKGLGVLSTRRVTLRFAPSVQRITWLAGRRSRTIAGSALTLGLEPGGGRLLRLEGRGLDALCGEDAIYRAARPAAQAPAREVAAADLPGIRAARVRLVVFGANGEPLYAAKHVLLNGARVGDVRPTNRDSWEPQVLELSPERLGQLKRSNRLEIEGAGVANDAWKVRGFALAVQLADGTWVKTNADDTVYAAKDWAHFEGTPIPANGVVGPMRLGW